MAHLHTFIAWMAGIVVATISAMGYAGVVLLMAIESTGVPIPSEVVMPFAGYLVSIGEMSLVGAATAGAIGCNLGSIPAYEIGKRGGRPLVARFGRYILLSPTDLDRAEAFFARWGGLAVLVGRLLPVVRSVIAYPAGVARMKLVPFHIYTFVGSWPWCFALAWVGMKLGAKWHSDPRVAEWFHRLDFVIVAAILAAGIWFVWHKLRALRRDREDSLSFSSGNRSS